MFTDDQLKEIAKEPTDSSTMPMFTLTDRLLAQLILDLRRIYTAEGSFLVKFDK